MESRIKFKFINIGTEMPVIKIKTIGGLEFIAIIDTGSESTLIDKTLVKENKKDFKLHKEGLNVNLFGLNGESNYKLLLSSCCAVNDTGSAELSFQNIDFEYINKNFEDKYHMRISALIGSDMLAEYNAVIDYDKQEVEFIKKEENDN